MRLRLIALALLALEAVACGLDPSLTCGDTCGDASISDGGSDATQADASDAASTGDADASGADVANDADGGCAQCNGNLCCAPQYCVQGSCCALSGSWCGGDNAQCCGSLLCTGGHMCEATCSDAGSSCVSSNDCCSRLHCGNGNTCMCNANGTSCSSDSDCCSGNCNPADGGKLCGP